MWQLTPRGHPAGAGSEGTKGWPRLVEHSEEQKGGSCGPPPTREWPPRGRLWAGWTSGGSGGPGGRRPSTGCSEVLVDPPGLFSRPWLGLGRVLLVRARPAQAGSPFCRSVRLSVWRDVPAITDIQSGCGGCGYLVFWRSSRSQVGSVWPILYSSLESSMLWSR